MYLSPLDRDIQREEQIVAPPHPARRNEAIQFVDIQATRKITHPSKDSFFLITPHELHSTTTRPQVLRPAFHSPCLGSRSGANELTPHEPQISNAAVISPMDCSLTLHLLEQSGDESGHYELEDNLFHPIGRNTDFMMADSRSGTSTSRRHGHPPTRPTLSLMPRFSRGNSDDFTCEASYFSRSS